MCYNYLSRVCYRRLLNVILIAFAMPSSSMKSETMPPSLYELTKASNQFAIHLYQTVKSGASGNLVLSPLSAQVVLTLAGHGARGVTAEEMSSLLHHNLTDIKLLESQKALLDNLTQSSILKVANRMYIDRSFKVKPAFQTVANTYFLSGLEVTDFAKNPEDARKSINTWVEGKTNNLIKNLLGPGVVSSMTRTVLVNAIHFKGMWAQKFNPAHTQEAPFHVGPNQTVPVQMMSLVGKKFKYAFSDALDAKLLEMPYEGHQYSMVIILPNKIDGLPQVEATLSTISLSDEISKMTEVKVDVKIPKFKIESEWELKENLKQMGMVAAFSASADFSGIADEPLSIDAIVQKAYIEVNEEGTEAAAATGASIRYRRMAYANEVNCEHPFGIMLVHSATGAVVIAARLVNLGKSGSTTAASADAHEEV